MNTPWYPFAAIACQPRLRLALLLASVDWRLSVLLRGDKGSGKTTAARGLADVLPAGAPFVNLPIGATEDRLLGGLDLGQALQGEAKLKRGLIHEAHGGVLYIDEVNLLSDALADALLDAASSGRHFVERDGFSAAADARFILLGSMNIEEGALRPQLLDRFALSLDVEAPAAPEDRASIVESRLRFDADPAAFRAAFEQEQDLLRARIVEARAIVQDAKSPAALLLGISKRVTDAGVRSLRADLAAIRAATACAALEGRAEAAEEDVESVLPLVLHHRTKRRTGQPQTQMERKEPRGQQEDASREGPGEGGERVFSLDTVDAPELRVRAAEARLRGRSAAANGTPEDRALDVVGSFRQSFRNTGTAALKSDQLVFRTPQFKSGIRFIFVIDASGSLAAQQRMRAVKGTVAALLDSSVDNKDEVAVLAFRGPEAKIVLEPCRDLDAALRVLEFQPTGGRTPLAHALELAASLVNPSSLLILLTDGRANVPLHGVDPWTDALEAARRLDCLSLLVDSSVESSAERPVQELAAAMKARLIRLDDLNQESLMSIVKQ
jgi:magnesium chelatase subunit D